MISHRTLRWLSAIALGLGGLTTTTAEVVFTGTVDPVTPGEVGPSDTVTVGPTQQTEPGGDPRGSIRVDQGTQFEAGRLLVGDNEEALASTRVSGLGTRLQLTSQGNEFFPTLGVGRGGSGFLEIEDGGWVSVGETEGGGFGVMTIGAIDSLGTGRVEVRGESSLLTVGRQLVIGGGVQPILEVSDAAVVRVGGEGVGVSGTIDLSGRRTELQTSVLAIGSDFPDQQNTAPAVVRVSDEAIVRPYTANGFNPGATIGSNGHLYLDGGVFALPIIQMHGLVQGSGVFTAGISINEPGLVRVEAGDRIEVQGAVESTGTVRVTDGSFEATGRFVNRNVGEFAGRSEFTRSDIRMGDGLTNQGEITLTDGTLRIDPSQGARTMQWGELVAERSRIDLNDRGENRGTIELSESELWLNSFQDFENAGRLVLDQSTVTSIINPNCCGNGLRNDGVLELRSGQNTVSVPVQGGGSLMIGGSASGEFVSAEFFGGVSVEAAGTASFDDARLNGLSITLDAANRERANLTAFSDSPENATSFFEVSGRLTVDAAELDGVQAEQVYKLIETDQLFGDFSEYELPDLPGTLEFLPELTDTELNLLVIDTTEILPGDFSGDGRVDAADYTLWRDGLPGGSRWLDHAMWSQNYGRTLSLPAAAVPEPGSVTLVILAACRLFRLRRATQVG